MRWKNWKNFFSRCAGKTGKTFFPNALEKLEKLEKLFFQIFFSSFFFHRKNRTITSFSFIMEKMEKYFIIKDVLVFNIHTHTKIIPRVCVCEK